MPGVCRCYIEERKCDCVNPTYVILHKRPTHIDKGCLYQLSYFDPDDGLFGRMKSYHPCTCGLLEQSIQAVRKVMEREDSESKIDYIED